MALPPPAPIGKGSAIFFLAAAVIAIMMFSNDGKRTPSTKPATSICPEIAAQRQRILDCWTREGIISETAENILYVEDRNWAAVDHKVKVSIAVAHFCTRHPDGSGVVMIKGFRDDKTRASVVDGNYFTD